MLRLSAAVAGAGSETVWNLPLVQFDFDGPCEGAAVLLCPDWRAFSFGKVVDRQTFHGLSVAFFF